MEHHPFFENGDDYMKWCAENEPKHFNLIAPFRERDRLGIAHPATGGSCSSDNCSGTTGCHKTTTNGYCACASPDGPCVWVPAA